MSLYKLSLPAPVITELYKHTLVIHDAACREDLANETGTLPAYRFLGNHLKKVTLVIDSPESFSVPEHHLLLLTKILEACKMTLADVAILNHAMNPVDIQALKEQLHPETIILFGVEPRQINLPFNSPAFKVQQYDDCRYLYAPAMNELNQDSEQGKLLKSKLWVCLRQVFSL